MAAGGADTSPRGLARRHVWPLPSNCAVVLVGVLVAAACGPHLHAPPAYPWPGFGRIGCYSGPGLQRGYSGETTPGDAAATSGPWLVLDSLTTTELYEAGYTDPITPSFLHPASLLERQDTLERTVGTWYRVPPDSLAFDEGSTFPPVYWRFRVEGDRLRGHAVLPHDDYYRDANGEERHDISRWAVDLVAVPCREVPSVKYHRPDVSEGDVH